MDSRHGLGITLAVCAGAMAALASVAAKLAMTEEKVHKFCTGFSNKLFPSTDITVCGGLTYLLCIICFAGIFIFNALMWTFYTKSLQYSASTIESTITNTGANFLFTAFLSFALFGEQLSILWWIGSCFILAGLLLIHKGNQDKEKTKVD